MADDNDQPKTKMQLVFAPGCFDGFEGTQEELDELVAEITKRFEDGSLLADGIEVTQQITADQINAIEAIIDSMSDDEVEALLETLGEMSKYGEVSRTLH